MSGIPDRITDRFQAACRLYLQKNGVPEGKQAEELVVTKLLDTTWHKLWKDPSFSSEREAGSLYKRDLGNKMSNAWQGAKEEFQTIASAKMEGAKGALKEYYAIPPEQRGDFVVKMKELLTAKEFSSSEIEKFFSLPETALEAIRAGKENSTFWVEGIPPIEGQIDILLSDLTKQTQLPKEAILTEVMQLLSADERKQFPEETPSLGLLQSRLGPANIHAKLQRVEAQFRKAAKVQKELNKLGVNDAAIAQKIRPLLFDEDLDKLKKSERQYSSPIAALQATLGIEVFFEKIKEAEQQTNIDLVLAEQQTNIDLVLKELDTLGVPEDKIAQAIEPQLSGDEVSLRNAMKEAKPGLSSLALLQNLLGPKELHKKLERVKLATQIAQLTQELEEQGIPKASLTRPVNADPAKFYEKLQKIQREKLVTDLDGFNLSPDEIWNGVYDLSIPTDQAKIKMQKTRPRTTPESDCTDALSLKGCIDMLKKLKQTMEISKKTDVIAEELKTRFKFSKADIESLENSVDERQTRVWHKGLKEFLTKLEDTKSHLENVSAITTALKSLGLTEEEIVAQLPSEFQTTLETASFQELLLLSPIEFLAKRPNPQKLADELAKLQIRKIKEEVTSPQIAKEITAQLTETERKSLQKGDQPLTMDSLEKGLQPLVLLKHIRAVHSLFRKIAAVKQELKDANVRDGSIETAERTRANWTELYRALKEIRLTTRIEKTVAELTKKKASDSEIQKAIRSLEIEDAKAEMREQGLSEAEIKIETANLAEEMQRSSQKYIN